MKEYFEYLTLRFDLTKARLLSQDAKYKVKAAKPKESWLAPFFVLREIELDLSKVALFATLLYEVKPMNLLIDGNEEVRWALDSDAEMMFKILDLKDTIKIMSGDPIMIKMMTTQAQRLKLYER